MAASTSTATFNKQRERQIIQVLLSLHKLSCIEWQKQRHCFTQNRMTRIESQIKLNNQVLLFVHNTKFTTLHLFPCTSEDYKNISNMIRDWIIMFPTQVNTTKEMSNIKSFMSTMC